MPYELNIEYNMDKICTPPCSSTQVNCYDSPGTHNKINQNLASLFSYFNMTSAVNATSTRPLNPLSNEH